MHSIGGGGLQENSPVKVGLSPVTGIKTYPDYTLTNLIITVPKKLSTQIYLALIPRGININSIKSMIIVYCHAFSTPVA